MLSFSSTVLPGLFVRRELVSNSLEQTDTAKRKIRFAQVRVRVAELIHLHTTLASDFATWSEM